MKSHNEEFLHEITPSHVLQILKEGAWQAYNTEISSAVTNTNDNQVQYESSIENTSGIDAFRDIAFNQDVKSVLDVGGGKFISNSQFMRDEKNINLLVWDPYGRKPSDNQQVRNEVEKRKVDAAVSMSVLNVVPDLKSRLAHIVTLWKSLKMGGKAYFKIWPGEGKFRGSFFPEQKDSYYQSNAYRERFVREIQAVFGESNVFLDVVPNLILARKVNESYLTRKEMEKIQGYSTVDSQAIFKIKQKFILRDFYERIVKNSLFYHPVNREMIEKNRHLNSYTQQSYDKKFGLTVILRMTLMPKTNIAK